MTLDEAIRHAEEVAEEQDKRVPYKIYDDDEWTEEQENCHKCAEEHRQLAKWLKDYKRLLEQPKLISVSEKLPKPNQRDGLTERYYLIQNEYGDMLVARYDGKGWEQIYQDDYLEDEVVAWMPLPKPYEPQERSEE